ncbi:MAG: thioredoxin family protein [Gallionellales bacterium 35-53-114]|jgi:glutaredoxin|nr:MAG: thioredoxin family protein [Gallionellales bacterium 35-53-114]OYZ64938.1 MAG: thioredoxin family protein [Gallionellales bacterium 24-53-125]OZB07524.1 MAG: thioredoxin family protein [Gallionellales bacterium 39-52-133]HQS58803.1 thioredoxin family protein [Gallionellaceae bacterium]HQS75144.1 thioredoxin family protein [Gallionellaceae bacterium]
MDVMIIATKGCSHCLNFKKELECLQIQYRVCYAEDYPDLVQKHEIRHSPNLVVDDEVVFRRQPTEAELKDYFSKKI